MPKTAVGLFKDPKVVGDVVRKIEALGFPRKEVRELEEAASFEVDGVMSFPRVEYEDELIRELNRIGATNAEAEAYVEGLRHGGALVFATGTNEKVRTAADIMSRNGALKTEEASGAEPQLPVAVGQNFSPSRDNPVLSGRIRREVEGATLFVW